MTNLYEARLESAQRAVREILEDIPKLLKVVEAVKKLRKYQGTPRPTSKQPQQEWFNEESRLYWVITEALSDLEDK